MSHSYMKNTSEVGKKTALKLLNKYADSFNQIKEENKQLKIQIEDLNSNLKINKSIIEGFFSKLNSKEKESSIISQIKQENMNLYNQNEQLRKKIEELNMILNEKDKEIEEYRIKYDNQLIQINKNFDNHINQYQQKLNQVQKEIQYKNQIINELKHNMGMDLNNSNDNNSNKKFVQYLQGLKDNIKNIMNNFFNTKENFEINSDYQNNNINNINDIESQFNSINNLINIFSQKLTEYKNNNIFQKFYLSFIDIMNNFISNISSNFFQFNDFPKFSLNDADEKKYNDILLIFKKISDFILQNQLQKKEANNINEELSNKLKEMSEVLNNSNKYLLQAKEENAELKNKYKELEQKYLNVIDFDELNNKLNNEIRKKNQQIKSLEFMITKLTNNAKKEKENDLNNNASSKSMMMSSGYSFGKIMKKKEFNEMKKKLNKSSFYLNDKNRFIKDEQIEKNLNMFLNKYTNGEYENKFKNLEKSKNANDFGIINLREEIEKYEKEFEISKSDDEIEKENNYNEEEEERKFQMEGKI